MRRLVSVVLALLPLSVCLLTFLAPVSADPFVFIDSAQLSSRVYALPAAFGPSFPAFGSSFPSFTLVLPAEADQYACAPLSPPASPYGNSTVVLVRRGPSNNSNCSFVAKAIAVQAAGAGGMLVINTEQSPAGGMAGNAPPELRIPSALLWYADGQLLSGLLPLEVRVSAYVRPVFDSSFFVMFTLAVGVVALAAYLSAAKERQTAAKRRAGAGAASLSRDEGDAPPIAYLDTKAAVCFVILASCSLLLLFFFINSLIYVLLALFALGGGQSLASLLALLLTSVYPQEKRRLHCAPLPAVHVFSVLAVIPAAVLSIVWFVYRNAAFSFVLQDVLGVSLLLALQRVIRLPNIRVSCILLTLAFLYDIFFVFISPLLFSSSVMTTVATGGGSGESVPMLLRLPRFHDELHGQTMLGLGDIALPGLLVSFLLRFDMHQGLSWQRGYFTLGIVGYAVGVGLTYVALCVMQQGQPALLYIVPCTLYAVLVVAACRGDLALMWRGTEQEMETMRREAERMNGGAGSAGSAAGRDEEESGSRIQVESESGNESGRGGLTASLLRRDSADSEDAAV